MQDQDWWSLGFEAAGPAHLLRAVLEATAGVVLQACRQCATRAR